VSIVLLGFSNLTSTCEKTTKREGRRNLITYIIVELTVPLTQVRSQHMQVVAGRRGKNKWPSTSVD
jgi:hypothetical protein